MMSMKMTMMNCEKHYDEHIDEIVWKCPAGTTSTKTPTTQLEQQFLNTNAKQIKMQIQLCGNVQILRKMWKCPVITLSPGLGTAASWAVVKTNPNSSLLCYYQAT